LTGRAEEEPALSVRGYASLFGVADLAGDVVRAGAFRETLRGAMGAGLPLLVRHDARLRAGRWLEAQEDARGLFVRGRIEPGAPGARLARRLIARGVDGLSIGFVTRAARARPKGRELLELDLVEVSLVDVPMMPQARLVRADLSALVA